MDMLDEIEHWKALLRNPNQSKRTKQIILGRLREAAEGRGIAIPSYNSDAFHEFIQ